MSWKSTADHYSRMSIALHWLMVLLFVLIMPPSSFAGYSPKTAMAAI